MSRDPERLLSAQGPSDELERALLISAKQGPVPAGAKDAAWLAIAAQIAATGTIAAATSAAASTMSAGASAGAGAGGGATVLAAKTGFAAFATKAAWTVAASSIALASYLAVERARSAPSVHERERAAETHTVERVARPLPAAPSPSARPSPSALPGPTPSAVPAAVNRAVAPRPAAEAGRRRDRLSAESALLSRARAQLRAGNVRGAEATLTRVRSQFRNGELEQERDVLAIELLAAEGKHAAAAGRARTFMRAYPNSPHSATMARFLDPP